MDTLRVIVITLSSALLVACGSRADDAVVNDSFAARVGKSTLTFDELKEKIPYGLSADDSVKFISAYVRQWVEGQLISEVAAKNVGNLEEIDKKVEAYRNELLMMEYRRLMYEEHAPSTLSDDSLKAFYDLHKGEFKLASPMVKGLYVKVPDNFPHLSDVKKWIKSGSAADVDHLEKLQLSNDGEMEYDYFLDSWTDWTLVSGRMPLDFSATPEMVSQSGKIVEMARGGDCYFLKIADVLRSGSPAPFDAVKESIRDYIASDNRLDYDRRLRQRLYEQGLADGDVEINVELSTTE